LGPCCPIDPAGPIDPGGPAGPSGPAFSHDGVSAVGPADANSCVAGSSTLHATDAPSPYRNVKALLWMPIAKVVGAPEPRPASSPFTVRTDSFPGDSESGDPVSTNRFSYPKRTRRFEASRGSMETHSAFSRIVRSIGEVAQVFSSARNSPGGGAGHAQDELPTLDVLPAGHAVHCPLPGPLKVSAGQATQATGTGPPDE
jgi:hypothetical protein